MNVLYTNLLILALMVMAPAQPGCDPLSQWEINGQCCKLCPPGTKMTTLGSCQNPVCKDCDENHYTDEYTQELECKMQPYCDPNKNFQDVVLHKNKKKRTICQCKLGFHCASQSCIICVPHKECVPGEWAAIKGGHSHDTKCEKCPNGTFSTETSWNSDCKKWTECESGYRIKEAGSHKSDNICEPSRSHTIIVVVIISVIIVAVLGVFWCLCRGKTRNSEKCVELCRGEKPKKQQKEGGMLLPQQAVHVEEESTFHDALPSQEETRVTPEENDDESGLESSSDVALTDKGNFVTQEDGKKEVVSRQESQTQKSSDHVCEC